MAQQIIDCAGEVGKLLHDSSPLRAMDILSWPGCWNPTRGSDPIAETRSECLNGQLSAWSKRGKGEGQVGGAGPALRLVAPGGVEGHLR